MAVNKVVVGGKSIIDLTGDTVTEVDVRQGKVFHDRSGTARTGTLTDIAFEFRRDVSLQKGLAHMYGVAKAFSGEFGLTRTVAFGKQEG